jgi:hypothetical protein
LHHLGVKIELLKRKAIGIIHEEVWEEKKKWELGAPSPSLFT